MNVDLDLFGKLQFLSRVVQHFHIDLSRIHPLEGNLPVKENIVADSQGPNIYLIVVALIFSTIEEFRSHVIRSAQFGQRQRLIQLGEPEVPNHDFIVMDHHIGQLEISVHYLHLTKHLEAFQYLLHEESGQAFPNPSHSMLLLVPGKELFQIASIAILTHNDDELLIVDGFDQTQDSGMPNQIHDANFVLEKLVNFVVDNFLLGHYFESEWFLGFVSGQENLAILALSNELLEDVGLFGRGGENGRRKTRHYNLAGTQ